MEPTEIYSSDNHDSLQNQTPIKPKTNIYKPLFFTFFIFFLVTASCLITISFTKNKIVTPIETVQPTFEITSIPSPSTIIDETQNWKTYTNSTYKYSIQYPNNWTAKTSTTGDFALTTPEYEKEIALIQKSGLMTNPPDGYYDISCYKNINEYSNKVTHQNTMAKTLSDYFTKYIPDQYSLLNKTIVNNFNTYEIELKGMGDGNKGYFIENTDLSICVISFPYRETTEEDNQFINTFKFY